MKNSKAVRRLSSQLVLPTLLCAVCASQPMTVRAQTLAELRAAHKAAYDPRVSALLKKMADAYAALTDLDQKTEFYLLQTPLIQKTEEEKRRRGEEETKYAGNRGRRHITARSCGKADGANSTAAVVFS